MRRTDLLVAIAVTLFTGSVCAQSVFSYAGGGTQDGRPATAVDLVPLDIVTDSAGVLYIADVSGNRIRTVPPNGIIGTIAGQGGDGFGGDFGPATKASLAEPGGVAFDSRGNLFIADTGNSRIRRVDAETGVISTVAGSGSRGFGGDGGQAVDAALLRPQSVVVDAAGNLFIADTQNARVRKVGGVTGIITTVAGNGEQASSGDGGPATLAALFPWDLAVSSTGDLYVADLVGDRVRRVDLSTGIITTVAGNGVPAFAGDGGPATQASLRMPRAVALDEAENLFISDSRNHRVRRVDASTGIITTVAGSGQAHTLGDGGPATEASLGGTDGIHIDSRGDLYITSYGRRRVRRVDAVTGIINTVAGNGEMTVGDGGPASQALLFPFDVTFDGKGDLIVSDERHSRIRRIDSKTGIVTTIAGTGFSSFDGDGKPATATRINYPAGLDLDRLGNLYFADRGNDRVRVVDGVTGVITTVAGDGTRGFSGDGGPATAASLNGPWGVVVGEGGDLFVADYRNHRVRRVSRETGVIETVAGNGVGAFAGDGGPATQASLWQPTGLALDADGNLYIADWINDRVRRVDAATGIITTVAGTGVFDLLGDGGPATKASMTSPTNLSFDNDGNLFISELNGHRVRRVDQQTKVITTVLGNGEIGYSGDGGPVSKARIGYPGGVAVDSSGNFFLADGNSNRIRVVYRCVNVEAPLLESPSDDSQGVSSQPPLSWGPVNGAFRYDVYLDTADPPAELIARDVSPTEYSPSNLEPLTTYYWKVVAKGDPYCDPFRTADSEVWSFTTTSSCRVPGDFDSSSAKP